MKTAMTVAQYAAHTEKVKTGVPSEVITLKSGSVFEVRPIDLKGMVQLGVIPQALVNESLKALQDKGKYIPSDSPELRVDGLILQREVVAAYCVMPPFNEETAKSFLPDDFNELYLRAMGQQGVEAEALKKSGKGRKRRTPGNRADGTVQRATVESAATN